MKKVLVIKGADFSLNKVKTVEFVNSGYIYDCTLENSTNSSPTTQSAGDIWFIDGEARDNIRGNVVTKVKVNAVQAGTLNLYLVNFANSTTHIPQNHTLIEAFNVSAGIQELTLSQPVNISNSQSVGIGVGSAGFKFALSNGGEPFSRINNSTDAVQFPNGNMNFGICIEV